MPKAIGPASPPPWATASTSASCPLSNTYNSDVETVHRLMEDEFFDLEPFSGGSHPHRFLVFPKHLAQCVGDFAHRSIGFHRGQNRRR